MVKMKKKLSPEEHLDEDGFYHRLDGPAHIDEKGIRYWYNHGELHRENGPAIEYPDGTNHWVKNNKRHRLEGPAIDNISWSPYDWRKQWWLNDELSESIDHPFHIFRKEIRKEQSCRLNQNFNRWPTSMKILFKLTYGG